MYCKWFCTRYEDKIINNELIEELYKVSDSYHGRVKDLLMLAASEIQKQELEIKRLKNEWVREVEKHIKTNNA